MLKSNKRIIIVLFNILCASVIGLIAPDRVDSKIVTNVPADVSGEELKAVVIEDFEEATTGEKGWDIITEPKVLKGGDNEKTKMKNPVMLVELKLIPGYPNDMKVEEWSLTGLGKKKEKCLGAHFQFRYPGTNSIHIIAPPEKDWKDKTPAMSYNPATRLKEQERGLQLPGKAKGISLWVHGRGNPYDLEVWVKDFKGDTHILKCGSVNFIGWRPIKVYLPTYIPQSFESYPQTRVTKIVRLVLRAQISTAKEELSTETFFFFDQIKALSDTYEVNFDGSDLHKVFEGGSTSTTKEPDSGKK